MSDISFLGNWGHTWAELSQWLSGCHHRQSLVPLHSHSPQTCAQLRSDQSRILSFPPLPTGSNQPTRNLRDGVRTVLDFFEREHREWALSRIEVQNSQTTHLACLSFVCSASLFSPSRNVSELKSNQDLSSLLLSVGSSETILLCPGFFPLSETGRDDRTL